jgi:diguanylate cyclase (GGDEF)-like protein
MKQTSPLVQMTMALVSLAGTLVLMADLFFGVLPDPGEQSMRLRKGLSEGLAVQVAALLQNDDRKTLQQTLDSVAARTEGVRSLAVRRADGTLVLQAGDHPRAWRKSADERSSPDQVSVPLHAGGARWGAFEIAFRADDANPLWRWLTQPLVLTLLFVTAMGTLVFGLYIRRALQHLDPASVIPDRVQGAFDALAEGVVVLDTRGRVLMANKAFRGLHRDAPQFQTGTALSSLPWLAAGLPDDAASPPWTRAMAERTANTGHTLQLGAGAADARQLVVNCAPITDPGGNVRGCLVTFDDTTELHRANGRLVLAMGELSASKSEIERKNEELIRLATRDPMTGCLNRRAFHEAFEPLLLHARENGTSLSCLMLDIDHFKSVNDSHGHAIGDRVIQEVAKKLQLSARATDLVCRYGGEEFVVVVPGLNRAEAMEFAERLRERIERECGPGVREVAGMRVTVSVGIDALESLDALGMAGTSSGHELVDRADQALYSAKRGGRNRVCLYKPPPAAASASTAIAAERELA